MKTKLIMKLKLTTCTSNWGQVSDETWQIKTLNSQQTLGLTFTDKFLHVSLFNWDDLKQNKVSLLLKWWLQLNLSIKNNIYNGNVYISWILKKKNPMHFLYLKALVELEERQLQISTMHKLSINLTLGFPCCTIIFFFRKLYYYKS